MKNELFTCKMHYSTTSIKVTIPLSASFCGKNCSTCLNQNTRLTPLQYQHVINKHHGNDIILITHLQ